MSVLKRGRSGTFSPTGKTTTKGAMQHDWDEVDDYQIDDNASAMNDPVYQFNIEPLTEYVDGDDNAYEVELTSSIVSAKHPALSYLKDDLYEK